MCIKNDLYLEFVKSEAEKNGSIFMLDTGEGRDFEDPVTGWYIEDLSGWLIETNKVEKFLIDRDCNKAHSNFGDNYFLVKWFKKSDGQIGVEFIKYSTFD